MYKQLEKLITLTNNDLNLVNRRFGQRTDITAEQLNYYVFYIIMIAYHNMI